MQVGLAFLAGRIFRIFRKIAMRSGDFDIPDIFGDGNILDVIQFLLIFKKPSFVIGTFSINTPDRFSML